MSLNSSSQTSNNLESPVKSGVKKFKWWVIIVFPVWVLIGFLLAQLLVSGVWRLMYQLGAPLDLINQSLANAIFATILYTVALLIVIGLPLIVKKIRINRTELGLVKLPTWTDIVITPAGLIVYLILSSVLMLVLTKIFPWININQVQDVGFNNLSQRYEFILAFVTLVVIAPVAEELLFRGYLFGKLKKYVPVWVAILATSLVFGAVHGQWALAIDTFALSAILCLLRQTTGSLWPSILLHMTKNAIAYYILFINPMFLTTLGK